MKWEETYEQAKYAFHNGEISDLLTGKGSYGLKVSGAPIDIPTDWTSVISKGIFELYENEQGARLIADYENAIRRLIFGSAVEVWMAANIVVYQLNCETAGKAAFEIDKALIDDLSKAIHDNKEALASDFSYQGNGSEFGLLDDILRLDGILQKECGIEIVKDKIM